MIDLPKTSPTPRLAASLLVLFALFALTAHAAQQDLRPGVLLPKITTTHDARQSYALYFPSDYAATEHWPIVYAFDPAARGALPVDLTKRK